MKKRGFTKELQSIGNSQYIEVRKVLSMGRMLCVLNIEDSEDDAALIQHALAEGGY
jgi:hypothetical protein